jgi:hypothetical protein
MRRTATVPLEEEEDVSGDWVTGDAVLRLHPIMEIRAIRGKR